MKLEDIIAEIRPRSNWEAVDLGWALTRRHFGLVLLSWMVTIWPIWALIIGLLYQSPAWALAAIVVLKPLYDHVPLFVLSRALFGVRPTPGAALKAWPKLFFSQFFRVFFISRFSAWRSLTAPVADLEGLSGSLYYRRASILSTRCGAVGWWMQVSCWMIMHSVWIGLFILGLFFIPENYKPAVSTYVGEAWNAVGDFLAGLWFGEFRYFPAPLVWSCIGLYLVALTVIHPLYVGGGFGLYLNARSHIEGWDIELTFRRLANRLSNVSKAAAIVLAVFGFGLIGGQQLLGQVESEDVALEPTPEPDAAITEVLADPDFEIHTEKYYYYRDQERERKPKPPRNSASPDWNLFGAGGGGPVQIVFWLVIGLAIALVLWLIVSNLSGFRRQPAEERAKAKTVMGMSVERESLPPDVITVARQFWGEGRQQESVGLLYRAAISWLIDSRDVPIEESDTEVDCVRRAKRLGSDEGAIVYFARLTGHWVSTAYGGSPPTDREADELFDHWPFDLRSAKR